MEPDADGGGFVAGTCMVMAWAEDVDVVLGDGCGDHGEGGDDVPHVDALYGGEIESKFADEGVDELVHEWDGDY